MSLGDALAAGIFCASTAGAWYLTRNRQPTPDERPTWTAEVLWNERMAFACAIGILLSALALSVVGAVALAQFVGFVGTLGLLLVAFLVAVLLRG